MNYITPPWSHQKDLVENKIIGKRGFALFWEMGTGKTKGLIDTLRYRFSRESRVMRTLILAPPVVVPNWKDEFKVHSKIPNVYPLQGPVRKRLEAAKKAFTKTKGEAVLVTNYEALLNKDFFNWLSEEFNPEVVVLDEAHKIKNISSKRYKACIKLAGKAEFRYALTGTPILNTQMDIFGIAKFVDLGEAFGNSFTAFKAKYFKDLNAGMSKQSYFPNWVFRPSMAQEFSDKVGSFSMAVNKSECLDLPPLVKKKIVTEMSPEQKKVYKEMQKDLVSFIKDKKDDQTKPTVARMALTKALRLMQISSGFASVENEGEDNSNVVFEKNPKLDTLREIIEENHETRKIIVWAVFKENYKAIRRMVEELGVGIVEVHGQVSEKKRKEAIDSFNKDNNTRVFLGHPGSGGIGINLTVSDLQVHYSRGFNLEFDRQSEARNYRGGSEVHESITRIDLVSNDTIEGYVIEKLQGKEAIGAKLIFGMDL